MVMFVQRVADGDGVLAPNARGLKFTGCTLVPHPDESLSGSSGGDGQVTGYIEVVPNAPTVFAVTTTNATPAPVYLPITIPVGFKVVMTVHIDGACTVGADLGKTYTLVVPVLIGNQSGTASGGALTPTVFATDFGGGVGIADATFAGSVVTLNVAGEASNTIKWRCWIEHLDLIPIT